MGKFFDGLEDNLLAIFEKKDADNPHKVRDAAIMASDAHEQMFGNIFSKFLTYPDEDFQLAGVHLAYREGKVELLISIQSFLNPMPEDMYEFEDEDIPPPPILDRIGSLDATQRENDFDWTDIEHNFEDDLDEVETMIAKSCFYDGLPKSNRDHTTAVNMVYAEFSGSGAGIHYHSRDPNQLSFDL